MKAPQGAGRPADEAALELMKQLITLAAGVLALSATFVEKLRTDVVALLVLLALSWAALICSLLFGLQTISGIVQSRLNQDDRWSRDSGRLSAQICKFAFLAGITAFALFAFAYLLSLRGVGSTTKGI
jgi:hypothetical protein